VLETLARSTGEGEGSAVKLPTQLF